VRPETDVHSSENAALPSMVAEIPSVDRLLNARALQTLMAQHGRTQVAAAVRGRLQELRRAALDGKLDRTRLTENAIAAAVEATLTQTARLVLRPLFNLTGTHSRHR
jgi:L-seryl-tRNA(Ser) seleniumtransferase